MFSSKDDPTGTDGLFDDKGFGDDDDNGDDDDDDDDDDDTTGDDDDTIDTGLPPDPSAPQILSLSTNTDELTEGGSVLITAVVTDPDGIEDVIGGELLQGGSTLGAFTTADQEGAYSITVSWYDLDAVETIEFEGSDERVLLARFYDVAGHTVQQQIPLTLTCYDSPRACGGQCKSDFDPYHCGECGNVCYALLCENDTCVPNCYWYPNDPLCVEDCDNGTDDDGDFYADCDDFDCTYDAACAEDCDNGIDDDGDFYVDCNDFACNGDPACVEDCDDGLDNDGDYYIDCFDFDCSADPACTGSGICPEDTITGLLPLTVAGSTLGASDDYLASCTFGPGFGSDVTFEFTSTTAGYYYFDTLGSAMSDTVLMVLDSCAGYELACNDDWYGAYSPYQSSLSVYLGANQTVIVVVDGYSAYSAGSFILNVSR